MQRHTDTEPTDRFPTDARGLPDARSPELVELADGERLDLRIAPVAKRLGDATVRMLAYNGSIPGPILKVQEGSEVIVDIENHGDMDATVHWHGLRLENRYDGTHETQPPILAGETFSARVTFAAATLSVRAGGLTAIAGAAGLGGASSASGSRPIAARDERLRFSHSAITSSCVGASPSFAFSSSMPSASSSRRAVSGSLACSRPRNDGL